ncbi:MAG: hypothetical protein MUE46_12180 [Xanthomonadales bacterium]|nr:hypothetical protein [Xanthomonadales bacterium]
MAWLLFGLLAAPLGAQQTLNGQSPGGAYWTIQTPAGWRPGNGLVLINHGYDAEPIHTTPSLGPAALRERVLSQGLALAASSYRLRGWALFATATDHRELLRDFRGRVGEPGPVWVVGGSMGGLVALQQAEQGDLGVVGAYAICAPLAGSSVWDLAADIRLVYDALCDEVSGGSLPRGPAPYPWLLPPGAVSGSSVPLGLSAEMLYNVSRCLGINVPPWAESSGMRDRLRRFTAATGVGREFLLENLYYGSFALSDLVLDPAKLGRRAALDNRFVDYGDAGINAQIRRVAAEPVERYALKRAYTPGLGLGAVKLLTTHTSGDGLVVPGHARALEGRVPAAQWSRAMVVEAEGSHCDYSGPELLAGWDALYGWTRGSAAKPDAAALQSRCEGLRAAGLAGDCRYAELPAGLAPVTAQIRDRRLPTADIAATSSGLWFDPTRNGEGWLIEALGDGQALVLWFTYPAPGADAEQRWMIGVGRVLDEGLVVEMLQETRGGRFGDDHDPRAVQRIDYGRLDFAQTGCGRAQLAWQGSASGDRGRRDLQRLTHLWDQRCPGTPVGSGSPVYPASLNGTWHDPARDGEGLVVQVQDDGNALLVWFTYDDAGRQRWLYGSYDAASGRFPLRRPIGARFGAAFDPAQVQQPAFGHAQLRVLPDQRLRLDWRAPDGRTLSRTYGRLTRPLGL